MAEEGTVRRKSRSGQPDGSAPCHQRVSLFGVASGKWRNGRRARFRSVCPKGRGGSTPPLPTLVETDDEGPAGIHSRGAFVVLPCSGTRLPVDLGNSAGARRRYFVGVQP